MSHYLAKTYVNLKEFFVDIINWVSCLGIEFEIALTDRVELNFDKSFQ